MYPITIKPSGGKDNIYTTSCQESIRRYLNYSDLTSFYCHQLRGCLFWPAGKFINYTDIPETDTAGGAVNYFFSTTISSPVNWLTKILNLFFTATDLNTIPAYYFKKDFSRSCTYR